MTLSLFIQARHLDFEAAEETDTDTSHRYEYCDDPKRKEEVVFPDSIIGRASATFDMYSGYINVTNSPDYLFYWFFGTQDGNDSAPLVIWTNGRTVYN